MSPLSITDVRWCLLWGHYGFSWQALEQRLRATACALDVSERARPATTATMQALRRVCRRASIGEREDAVRWLLALGPRATASTPDVEMTALATAELVERLERAFPAMPRREMQELVRRGDQASPALIAILRRAERTTHTRGLLWAIVVLGTIADAGAIDALARMLRHPSSEITSAAAEALGKIGSPAFDRLRQTVLGGRGGDAVHAYGGLAMIHTDEAFEFLCERLVHAPGHADVAAGALARHRRPEALAVLRAQRRRVPVWMRGAVADAIGALDGDRPSDPLVTDWRLRYRRLPSLGWGLPPSWIQIAALVREHRRAASGVTGSLRLAAHRYCEPPEHRCRRCGGAFWEPIGLPVCAHTASAVVDWQAGIIREWCAEGTADVWTALDVCDAADLARAAHPASASPVAPTTDAIAIARATLYWIVSAGLEDMRAAARYLRLVTRDLRILYEQAQRVPRPRRNSARFRYPSVPRESLPQIFS